MKVQIKNNATDKEIWLFLLHAKQDDKATPKKVLDRMFLRIMIRVESGYYLSFIKNI